MKKKNAIPITRGFKLDPKNNVGWIYYEKTEQRLVAEFNQSFTLDSIQKMLGSCSIKTLSISSNILFSLFV
ncbi:hypothetical protein IIB49_02175 [Patescibacteria group bacterium]|nr:hypothetical protein [Patescibacteria group bacterium]